MANVPVVLLPCLQVVTVTPGIADIFSLDSKQNNLRIYGLFFWRGLQIWGLLLHCRDFKRP